MIEKNKVYTIQPISSNIENITLYQDEQIKILEVKINTVKFLRINTNEILELPTLAIKTII